MDAGTGHEHDDQEEERDYGRHVFFLSFFHRARAARRAISRRCSAVTPSQRALPPFRPPFRPRATA